MINVVAIDMGYGHLRAAQPLADALSVPLLELDRPPLATSADERSWSRARAFHEGLSRASQMPLIGRPFLALMDGYTRIAPLDGRDLSRGNLATRGFARLVKRGLGSGLVSSLRAGARLLTTFYAPALIADCAGLPSACVVTDADCHRIWVPDRPASTRIRYFAPSPRVEGRLRAYGVPRERITLTGFPLPLALLGDAGLSALRANLSARLLRLGHHGEWPAELSPPGSSASDQPPLIVFAIGGAGAQVPLALQLLESLAPALETGRLQLALIAGLRRRVADSFAKRAAELGVQRNLTILYEPAWPAYYRRFNELLARADVLWTKPSELTFYASLGLPLVLAPHVGDHERYNAEWAQSLGAAIPQRDPGRTEEWLSAWLRDGTLAAAALAGFRGMSARGTHEIAAAVTNSPD